MRALIVRAGVSLLASSLLFLVAATQAAAPIPGGPKISSKYCLDDAFSIAVVNVRRILDAHLYSKNYEKQVEEILKMEPVAGILQASGVDPRKDVDFIYTMSSRGSFINSAAGKGGPAAAHGPVILEHFTFACSG